MCPAGAEEDPLEGTFLILPCAHPMQQGAVPIANKFTMRMSTRRGHWQHTRVWGGHLKAQCYLYTQM